MRIDSPAAARPAPVDLREETRLERELADRQRAREEAAKAALKRAEEQKERQDKLEKSFTFQKTEPKETKSIFEQRAPKPTDNSAQLTLKLVAAEGQFAVRRVMSDAAASLAGLRKIAASGGKDAPAATAAIKKLEKLLSRARSKLRALNDEDAARIRRSRAERRRQKERAEELAAELRKRKTMRKAKEHGYLIEQLGEMAMSKAAPGTLDSAAGAAIAAAETAGAGIPGGADMAAAAGGTSGGGDAASFSGGEVSAE